jgi:hypothetical protein
MTPRRKSAAELYDLAFAALDAAGAQSRLELAESEARVARLKHAAELEKLGRQKEADRIIAAVAREQRRLDVVDRALEEHAAGRPRTRSSDT